MGQVLMGKLHCVAYFWVSQGHISVNSRQTWATRPPI